MKKLSFVLFSSILFAACTPKLPQMPNQNQTADQAAKEFEEVGKAIQAGKAARCLMTNKKDATQTATYVIKGEKIKMVGSLAANGQNGGMISDGSYTYIWDTTQKTGTKFKIDKETAEAMKEDAKQQAKDVPDFSSEEDRKAYEDMGYSVDCKVENVSDTEFVPPADVKFTDMSQLIEQTQKMYNSNSVPSAADQEAIQKQYQDMVKQYGQ